MGKPPPQPGEPPTVVVTDPTGEKGETEEGPAFNGIFGDRWGVYGSNVLPVRKTRSLARIHVARTQGQSPGTPRSFIFQGFFNPPLTLVPL